MLLSFFQISVCALAALETAAAVSASVIRLAEGTNTVTAFVANVPFACAGELFPATLARNIDHTCVSCINKRAREPTLQLHTVV